MKHNGGAGGGVACGTVEEEVMVLGASVAQNAGCLDQPGKRCMAFSGTEGRKKGWAVLLPNGIVPLSAAGQPLGQPVPDAQRIAGLRAERFGGLACHSGPWDGSLQNQLES